MKKETQVYFINYSIIPDDSTAFPPHKICPYQCEKDFGNGEILEIGFRNGRMYQITKEEIK